MQLCTHTYFGTVQNSGIVRRNDMLQKAWKFINTADFRIHTVHFKCNLVFAQPIQLDRHITAPGDIFQNTESTVQIDTSELRLSCRECIEFQIDRFYGLRRFIGKKKYHFKRVGVIYHTRYEKFVDGTDNLHIFVCITGRFCQKRCKKCHCVVDKLPGNRGDKFITLFGNLCTALFQ